MKARVRFRLLVPAAALAWVSACAGPTGQSPPMAVHPGAPGEASRSAPATAPAARGHTAADVAFMRGMLVHHAQAVEMTALVRERAEGEAIRTLARRIESSQEDEMAMMRRWLEQRGEPVPGAHAHHAHAGMPGMASPEQMDRLRTATGVEFDRLFLDLMIHHHEGAVIMVAELFASEGAGQEGEIFQFASHVDSDQRMEIARMRRLRASLG